jgi:hypothetical protein
MWHLEIFAHYFSVSVFQSKSELYRIVCADSQGEFLSAIAFKFPQFKRAKILSLPVLSSGFAIAYNSK